MSNLTLSVDEDLIRRARVRAIQQGSSLSAKVREFLRQYADESEDLLRSQRASATARLLDAMALATPQAAAEPPTVAAASLPSRRTLRQDLYEDNFRARDSRVRRQAGK